MMWKRTAAALLSGAMTLGLLTGCGGAPSASSGSGAASAPAAAEGMDKSDTLIYGANSRVSGINTQKTLGHHGAGIFWNIETWELN